jgi:antitoxin component of MazEF toxin-antitoxin module
LSATAIREKRQTTLPADVVEAAELKPGDQVDWRFENGEIRGRKLLSGTGLVRLRTVEEALAAIEASPLQFKVSWDDLRKETR